MKMNRVFYRQITLKNQFIGAENRKNSKHDLNFMMYFLLKHER